MTDVTTSYSLLRAYQHSPPPFFLLQTPRFFTTFQRLSTKGLSIALDKMAASMHYHGMLFSFFNLFLCGVSLRSLQPSSILRRYNNALQMYGGAIHNGNPVLVSSMDSASTAFLQSFAAHHKVIVQPVQVEKAASEGKTIAVIDANTITEANAGLLKQMNAIYILAGGNGCTASSQTTARNACKYDLYLAPDDATDDTLSVTNASDRLDNLLQRLRAPVPTPEDTLLDAGEWSHFVSLTFPSIDKAVSSLPALRIGADAFELRVDLLEDISVESLHRQIALLRDTCPLPIVFTVRSIGQIGKFPKEPERIFGLLREGLRAGCEWIDVEACWPTDQTDAFTSLATTSYAHTSRLLGSLHVTVPQTHEQINQIFSDCDLNGRAHILKAVTGASNDADCQLIHTAGNTANSGKPYIGVCLGADGARSRVLNRRFTPVTHKLMATAAPGQLTVEELMERRLAEGLCYAKKYFLFGTPIQHSLSPAMHNFAFGALLMPHKYALNEQQSVDAYLPVLADPLFGGASVTIPHKETIIPLLDEVRGAACTIGAVNTIVVEADGRKVGYNTDWLGIKRPVLRQLRSRGVPWDNANNIYSNTRNIGLIIGAGGAARAAIYAVQDLGLDAVIYNPRDVALAEKVAAEFGGKAITVEEFQSGKVLNPSHVHLVISCIPAEAEFELPAYLLDTPVLPVIFDAVYKPAYTKLIAQAKKHGCFFVQGATMLLEQGLEQFELWHKRRAPRIVMDAAVFNGVERLN